jgi:hypothetical protein
MKSILLSLALAGLCVTADAQAAGPVLCPQLLAGDTSTNTSLLPATTNRFNSGYFSTIASPGISISEYDQIGFTMTLAASAAYTGTTTIRFCQSLDGGLTYESNPSFSFTSTPMNGTTPITFSGTMFCPVATHIRLYDWWNTNSTVYFTNAAAKIMLKTPKRGANTNVRP